VKIRPTVVWILKTSGLYRPLKAVIAGHKEFISRIKTSLEEAVNRRAVSLRASFEVRRNIPRRAAYVYRYYRWRIRPAWRWLFTSRELANFTYDLSDRGKLHTAHAVATATSCTAQQAKAWIDELVGDEQLRATIVDSVRDSSHRYVADARAEYGRRVGWYAIVRAVKPALVIETGVDKGLGSMVLCAALQRNAAEGFQGRYVGTDINPSAGELLQGPYAQFGEVRHGDSIATLIEIQQPVDVFINDSDHSGDYERREYEVMESKLSPRAIVIGDNSHVTDELANFASRTGRKFIAVRELPKDHWYLGATTGIAF
jgi:hypothetical protein